jgi:hypothetical protein
MGGFVGIAKLVLQFAPVAIDTVERILGKGNGSLKKAAAAKEVVELLLKGVNEESFYQWDDLDYSDVDVLDAIKNEDEFVELVANVNDATVALVNYIAKHKKSVA